MIVRCLASKAKFFYFSRCWSDSNKVHYPWQEKGSFWLGPITEIIRDRIEYTPTEIEYLDSAGNTVAYWAYGDYQETPKSPYYSDCWK